MSDVTMTDDQDLPTMEPLVDPIPTPEIPSVEGKLVRALEGALDLEDDEPTIEELLGDEEDEPPAGMEVLNELSDAEPEEVTAAVSYGYDKELAEGGKWFKWPKLGPSARVKLCKTGNKRWNALLDRARVRYGTESGTMKAGAMERVIEPFMAKTIFVGMDGVVVSVKNGVPAPPLPDTVEGRLRLLVMFTPDLRDELFKAANNPRNFRDLSEEVLGN